jgi:hypothetical protein
VLCVGCEGERLARWHSCRARTAHMCGFQACVPVSGQVLARLQFANESPRKHAFPVRPSDPDAQTRHTHFVFDISSGHVTPQRTTSTYNNTERRLHVDQEHDPTLMLERALNGARSCNYPSKHVRSLTV